MKRILCVLLVACVILGTGFRVSADEEYMTESGQIEEESGDDIMTDSGEVEEVDSDGSYMTDSGEIGEVSED